MLIDFKKAKEITVPGMNNGTGTMTAKMYMDEQGKIISCAIHKGGSIGLHKHETVTTSTTSYRVPVKQFVTVKRSC